MNGKGLEVDWMKEGRKELVSESGMEQSNNGNNTRSEDVGCENEGLGDGFWAMERGSFV